jgi:hypothetical protein
MWAAEMWHLHHKIPAHTALSTRVLGKTFNSCPSTTPYLPDLSPPDFFIFPKLNMTLTGRKFRTVENIEYVTNDLKAIQPTAFKQCFQ